MKADEYAAQFIARVENLISMKSDPVIINRILSSLNLDKLVTNSKEFNDFIEEVKSQEIDLIPLLSHVKSALIKNKPLCAVLAYIQKHNLVDDAEIVGVLNTLQLQINLLCVFEAMIFTMANGKGFAQDIYNHVIKRRHSLFPGNPFVNFLFGVPLATPIFQRLKMISVDPGMVALLFHRSMDEREECAADIQTFIKKYRLSALNTNIKPAKLDETTTDTIPALSINILEAIWEDATSRMTKRGGIHNAKAGLGLIALMEERQYKSGFAVVQRLLPEGAMIQDDLSYGLLPELKTDDSVKKVGVFSIDPQWRDLYNSWNLFFVMSNVDEVFMPIKLLAPSVLSAEPAHYKEIRTLSLFLCGNLFLSEKTKSNPIFASPYHFEHSNQIMAKWGEINQQYANRQLKKFCPHLLEEGGVDSLYRKVMGRFPSANFAGHLFSYAKAPQRFNLTKEVRVQPEPILNPSLFFSRSARVRQVRAGFERLAFAKTSL